MSDQNTDVLQVAIIGSGPAGFYTAEALTKGRDDIRVDIIDRLPTPYGLIRGGVAPDHQSIKGVFRRYEKAALQETINFVGNLRIGRDISLDELRALYDAVVIATGAPLDRKLGIPGEDKKGVIGSAAFVGWYNSHPDFADLAPDLNITSAVVIGNGNVAIDVARILVKTRDEMAQSDIASFAEDAVEAAPLTDVWIMGRRGATEAKFTTKELGELGQLERCVPLARPDQVPDEAEGSDDKATTALRKNLAHLKAFTERKEDEKPIRLHIEFCARPVEVLGDDKVEGLRLERTVVEDGSCKGTNEFYDVPCQLIVPCIGYRSEPLEGAAFNADWGLFDNDDGMIEPGLYATGWARRGPSGTIGTNRPDGISVAEKLLANETPGGKPGSSGLLALASERDIEIVSFDDWKLIEAAEESAATGVAPRAKIAHIDKMLDIVRKAHG